MADNLREHPPQRDIAGDAAQEKANRAPEEISNQARGHTANLSNPSKSGSCYQPSSIHGKIFLLTDGAYSFHSGLAQDWQQCTSYNHSTQSNTRSLPERKECSLSSPSKFFLV